VERQVGKASSARRLKRLRKTSALFFRPDEKDKPEGEEEGSVDGRAEDMGWHIRKDGTRFRATGYTTPLDTIVRDWHEANKIKGLDGGDTVMDNLKLINWTNKAAGQAGCAFCGEPFELLCNAAVLCEGNVPRGYVCHDCLIAGPNKVAERIRARAKKLYNQGARARESLPGNQWVGIVQTCRERVDYWEALAEWIEKMPQWKLEETGQA
jgi:hypothetical protein